MHKFFLLLITLVVFFYSCTESPPLVELQSSYARITINQKGTLSHLGDGLTQTNYLPTDTLAPLLSIRVGGKIIYPSSASIDNQMLTLYFEDRREAKIQIEQKPNHITFELVAFKDPDDVELVIWGPIPTTINSIIGETIGVVRSDKWAIGIQALNAKTLGGFPWTDNDCMPQFDIFEQEDYSDLSEENKRHTLYRVEAAKPEKYGSSLQAYCRNRTKERIITNLSHERYVSPVYDDGGIVGSKIALFACPVEKTLEILGNIEIEEGLPHPMIDGVWGKQSRGAAAAYLIYPFNEHNIDKAIAYTQQAGLRYLYHPGPFKNWGHFELNEVEFPNGREGLKSCVEKASKAGLYVGLHTLSNFTTTDDPYVTPIPDPRLGKVGSSILTENIDAIQTEIPIESPDFFNQYKNNNLHGVMLGEELIRYESVSDTPPWRLLNCQRGAWGTQAKIHAQGSSISKLADHGYKVFLTDPALSIEQAERIADLYNYCGLRQISFDGLEGNRSTGMGNYGEILFTSTWWHNLSEEQQSHMITDASRTSHFFWHIYSRMNWGEPWYAGFRESQTEYRMKNQAYFQRNLMPGMLGWFSMKDNTPIEDIEWMLARSAAYDAGYAFVTDDKALNANGQYAEILKLIGEWEKVRMAGAFSEKHKDQMKDINKEFHLESLGENHWQLAQIHTFKFNHEDKVRQPGEPLFSTFEFENPGVDALLNFILTAQDASISSLQIELDNCCEIKIPIALSAGQSARYYGGNTLKIFNVNLQKIKEIPIDPTTLNISKGNHSIIFDCTFTNKGTSPMAKLEVRITDQAEDIRL